MKRRLFALLFICLLLTGCGKKARIGLCLAGPDSEAAWMEDSLKKAGYQVAAENAGLDQAVQNRQIKELLAEEYDLLILEPVMAQESASLAALAETADVPVLFVGKNPENAALSWKKTAYIGLSAAQAGQVQGQLAAQLPGADLNGDGVICYAILTGPEADMDARAMEESCREALRGTCLDVCTGDWTREAGEKNGAKLLSTWGKDLEVLICQSDDLTMGAMEAIQDGGRTVGEDIFLVSIGGTQMDKLLVKSGDLSGIAAPDMESCRGMILETVKLLLSGRPAEKQQYGVYIPITPENVADYLD